MLKDLKVIPEIKEMSDRKENKENKVLLVSMHYGTGQALIPLAHNIKKAIL
jgi:hypothetical protein